MAKNNITPIQNIIKSVFKQMESEKTLSREDVESRWKELVGEDGFKHSRPITLRKTVLSVLVDSPPWMQDMALKKRNLLKRLKLTFGKDRISKIQFKIGEL